MAGGNPSKSSSHTKPSFPPPSSHRKSRWESSNSSPNPYPNPNSNPNLNSKSNPKTPSDSKLKPQSQPSSSSKPSPKPGRSPTSAHPKTPHPPRAPPSSFSLPDPGPPPPPSYGFHMLERRTISLADGSVRSYFALPPDYRDSPPLLPMDPVAARFFPSGPRPEFGLPDSDDPFFRGRQQDYLNPLGPEAGQGSLGEGSLKRRFGDEELDKARKRQQVLQYGNDPDAGLGGSVFRGGLSEEFRGSTSRNGRLKHVEVDQVKLKKAFLHYVKAVNENANQKKNYIDNGKHGSLKCIVCGRSSKDFPDMHALIMHTYSSENADMLVDHLGLHKALCVLMGWNYSMPPDNSKAYQVLSAEEAAANQEDLIMWPPMVVIHNTVTGKIKDGRIEGLGNKAMDALIRELGFTGGKSKSLYGREGHLGITMIKFSGDQAGLREAMQMAEHFLKENHGRKGWTRLQPLTLDDDNNSNLVRVDPKTGEKKRIFYGYLAIAADLDKLDFETRKKVVIESRRDQLSLR